MINPSSPRTNVDSEIRRQREYYAQTANHYDSWHVDGDPQHRIALAFLDGAIRQRAWTSVLDVGAGTGRTLLYLARSQPDLRLCGIEPVAELRQQGYAKGIGHENLMDGDGSALAFPDNSFDVVCAFAVLHHVREPERVVSEMLRVARCAVFLSDSNCFGQGNAIVRTVKQTAASVRLWPLLNFIKTRGRGYIESDGDGIAYSYSVFDNEALLRCSCSEVYLLNTEPAGRNLYRSAGHVAALGIK